MPLSTPQFRGIDPETLVGEIRSFAVDEPLVETTPEKPMGSQAEGTPGAPEGRVGNVFRLRTVVVEVAAMRETAGTVFGEKPLLPAPHLLEPDVITVDDGKTMGDLVEPEVQVRDVSGQLMPVQSGELRQLPDEQIREFR